MLIKKKLMVLLLAGMLVAMMLATSVPAVAQQNASNPAVTVFVPAQSAGSYTVPDPGGTLSCTGSPYTAPSGTCTPVGKGMIAEGQVCDTPTAVTVFGTTQLSAFECHAPTSSSQFDLHDVTSPDASPTQQRVS
jgi:hypothetical protein